MKTRRTPIRTLLRRGDALWTQENPIGAAACYYEAAQRDSAEGAYLLGLLYSTDIYEDFVQDDRLAARFFLLAADRGHTEGQKRIAAMYATGCGVEPSREEADRYWRMAAEAGDADAQLDYATFLFFEAPPATERKRNVRAAKRWLRAAWKSTTAAPGVSAAASIALRHIREWEKTGILRQNDPEYNRIPDFDLDEPDADEP